MTRKSDSVSAAERALSLLVAFSHRDRHLTLAELARRVALDKATVLRLARTLANSGFLVRNEDSSWRLGPELARLGVIYQESFVLAEVAAPLLKELAEATGESAAIYVREGAQRICLFRHESEQSIRHHVRVGALLPLELGAPGRVILAFEGVEGAVYDRVRAAGHHVSFGERDPQVASAVVPLFEKGARLFGSLAVTGPPNRFDEAAVAHHLGVLRDVGRRLSRAMGGDTAAYGAPKAETG